jgi:hypothetical protein
MPPSSSGNCTPPPPHLPDFESTSRVADDAKAGCSARPLVVAYARMSNEYAGPSAAVDVAMGLTADSLAELRAAYPRKPFFVERDVVWTVQTWMLGAVAGRQLDLTVRTEHAMERKPNRARSADLALLTSDGAVAVAVEFKFEPAHRRADVVKSKLPVVVWGDVVKDSERVQRWTSEGRCSAGLAILVDEGGYFRHRPVPPGAVWHDWSEIGVAVLVTATFHLPVANR